MKLIALCLIFLARYLTSAQALADFAYLLDHIRSTIKGAEQSPTVVFGGSYGGMLAAYFRIKYPHIVVGAHASSAPILQMSTPCGAFSRVSSFLSSNFSIHLIFFKKVITQDFAIESTQCVDIVRSSWAAINRLASTASGLERLTTLFKFCRPVKSADEVKNWLSDMYAQIGMADYPYPTSFISELPAFPIRVLCANVTSPTLGHIRDDEDIVKRIAKGANVYFNYSGDTECFDTDSQGKKQSKSFRDRRDIV